MRLPVQRLQLGYSRGFIASPIVLVVAAVVVGIVVVSIVSGAFKFKGSVRVGDQTATESESSPAEPTSAPTPDSKKAQQSSVELSEEAYANSDLGFSINYPKGWEVKPQSTSVNIFLPSATKGAGQADALITASSMSAANYKDTKLSSIADLQKSVIRQQFDDVEFISEKDTKVAGLAAYEIEFTGSLGGESIHAKYFIVSGGNDLLYSLIIFSAKDVWEANQSNFAASLDTFKAL